MFFRNLLKSFLIWRIKHISKRNFILILSLFIGLIGGLIAVLLNGAIHYLHSFLTIDLDIRFQSVLYFLYPIIGVVLTVLLIKFLYRDEFAHGITNVLYAISKKSSIVTLKDTSFFTLGSLLTVGFGGSVGMEATLVMSGSGLGSNLARLLHLSYRTRMLLLGCGVASALAGFFHAPIAGVIFAMEILMLDLTMASLIPLLVSSVTGFIVGKALTGEEFIFNFSMQDPFAIGDIPFFILFGLFIGLVSFYFIRVDKLIDTLSQRFQNTYARISTGVLLLGLLIFLFPPLYGEGYEAIENILAGNPTAMLNNSFFYDFRTIEPLFLGIVAAIILLKAFAVSLTLTSGGIGGFFAPSLFLGGIGGFFFARLLNYIGMPVELSETNYMLVGMAGAMSSIFHAPLTAIFLIAELTGGYGLIVPLMIVSTLSYVFIIYFEPHSIFTRRLADKGELITHHKDKAVLTLLDLNKVIEKDLIAVSPDDSLGKLLKNAVAKSKRNIYPVVTEKNKLIGVVLLNDLRSVMFNQEMYNQLYVRDFMNAPPSYIFQNETMESVIRKFDETGAWNLPVIDAGGGYVGFVSKSKLFSAYRRMLVQFSED